MINLDWKPDKTINIPLYKQIAEYIKLKIESGEWPIGSILPSQRELADYFKVNRSTVSIALDELTADGLLEGTVGSGTKIVNNTWSLMKPTHSPDWNSLVEEGFHQPNLPTTYEINKVSRLPGIIRLSSGELSPEFYPTDLMNKVLTSLPNQIKSLGYEHPKGLLFLREQISAYLKSYGINVSPSSILIVSGALQGLQLISVGLLKPGSTLLLEKPSYLYSLNLFQTAGVRLCGLLLDSGGINLAAVSYQKRLTQSPFLYTIPCFNNPTGVLMSEKRRKDLLNICEQEELAIIEDDVYRELWLDSPPPPPIKAFDKTGLVIYLGSLSKSLSPGLRVGWIVGPETVIDRLADIKMQNDYGTSSLSQWVAAQWLASGLYQENLINIRNQLAFRRDICLSTLEANFKDIATWTTPPGGFYVWLNLKDNIPLSKLFKTALKKGILIHPGNIYDRFSTNQIRISFCYSTVDQIKFGLQELARTIREILLQHN